MVLTDIAEAPLRSKITVQDFAELRGLVQVEGIEGRLRWAGASPMIPDGHAAEIEIVLRGDGGSVVVHGHLESRSEADGFAVFLRAGDAKALLSRCERGLCRQHRRLSAEHLAIVTPAAGGSILCRVRDIGEGGARLVISGNDAGPVSSAVSIEILDAGLHGAALVLAGEVAWTQLTHVGIKWAAPDSTARAALSRLGKSEDPWELARAS